MQRGLFAQRENWTELRSLPDSHIYRSIDERHDGITFNNGSVQTVTHLLPEM